ncbi:hypothetical protein K474DRAFT_1656114 [Panus rudis PR-1116 ss-1]|nr:hypothetical protein K474DRAFT_1656114 [Panus rudis PR-1116 ss-1]
MRRIASIFAPKRSDRSDVSDTALSESQQSQLTVQSKAKSTKSRPSFLRTLSRNTAGSSIPSSDKAKKHPLPPALVNTGAPSSASSSSGGPNTPDDDRASILHAQHNPNSWIGTPWSPEARTLASPVGKTPPIRLSASDPRTYPPPPSLPQPRYSHEDTDDDTSSEESSESEAAPSPLSARLTPVEYLRTITSNAISPPFSPPPLLHLPNCPVFPRSCNPSRSLLRDETLGSAMFKKRLLRRLERGPLSRSEELAIAPLANRRQPPSQNRPSLSLDDNAVKDVTRIAMYSHGLRRWLSRPCFEERMLLYVSSDAGEIIARNVPGTSLGVAELEFSLHLEILAGIYDYPDPLSPMTPQLSMSPSTSSVTSTPPSLSTPPMSPALSPATSLTGAKQPQSQPASPPPNHRGQLYKAAPSPLRIEHSSSPTSVKTGTAGSSPQTVVPSSPLVESPTIMISPSSPEPPHELPARPARLNVRFAEDEKEDQIPLGYVLRIKQKREEKARFLEAQRQRRLHEEQRWKHEQERRKQEEERKKWEQERAQWDRERRAMEEERKKRMYAEELAAARKRRESTRFGSIPRVDSETPFAWDGSDRDRERERKEREYREVYARPAYDASAPSPRRQGSEPIVSRGRNESPSSSRPGTGSAAGSVRGSSRPPSMYSTPPSSAADLSSRERRDSKASRRDSFASVNDSSQRPDRSSFPPPSYPWMTSPAIPPVPPLPMMPVPIVNPYAMDMPLLPPTPPFVLQQFGHRPQPKQSRSFSSSPTPGAVRLPNSHSTDRVDFAGGNLNKSHQRHERRASGDVTMSASSMHHSNHDRSSRVPSGAGSRTHSYDRSSSYHGSQPTPPRTPDVPSGSSTRSSSRQPHSSRAASFAESSVTASATAPRHVSPPVPVTTHSWHQPAFQNLSRPSSNRRQTMIS